MTCTFTYYTDTDIGKVRREINDIYDANDNPGKGIKPDGSNFCDEDIEYYLNANDGSIIGAARNLMIVLATAYATQATEVQLGPYRESYKDQLVNIRRQIAMLERRYEDEVNSKPGKIKVFHSVQLGVDFS